MKKTIALSTIFAASMASANPVSYKDAIEKLTGPNQPTTGENSICVKVDPYQICSLAPQGPICSDFYGFLVTGVSPMAQNSQGECMEVQQDGVCETGFVKITSTAPIKCNVPIGL